MKVEWEIEDGYVGKSRPQTVKIDDGDILDCETERDVRDLVAECIQERFEEVVSPTWDDSEIEKVIEFWKEHKAEHDANN